MPPDVLNAFHETQTVEAARNNDIATSPEPGHLQIIRTSVDRPDITISVVPIRRRGLRDYSPLLFLLSPLKLDRGCKSIPKTIIFIDDQTVIHVVANVLRWELKAMGYSRDFMGTVIREFSSEISEHDKDVVFGAFKDPESTTRIVVATNAFEMGMDPPGVEVVVQWNLPVKPATRRLMAENRESRAR